MFTEYSYNTGVVTINYTEIGVSGHPLVLLYGGSARWQSSLPIIPELSQRWHLLAWCVEVSLFYIEEMRMVYYKWRVQENFKRKIYAMYKNCLYHWADKRERRTP